MNFDLIALPLVFGQAVFHEPPPASVAELGNSAARADVGVLVLVSTVKSTIIMTIIVSKKIIMSLVLCYG